MKFPYSESQIETMVEAEKAPRDWDPIVFVAYGEESRRCDCLLEREDGKPDRIRLVVRAGRVDDPSGYAASLSIEDVRVRGIDYHVFGKKRFYREVSPPGWHEDIIDPNLDPADKGHHKREALPDFKPVDLRDFLHMVCKRWNILLPPSEDRLL